MRNRPGDVVGGQGAKVYRWGWAWCWLSFFVGVVGCGVLGGLVGCGVPGPEKPVGTFNLAFDQIPHNGDDTPGRGGGLHARRRESGHLRPDAQRR